VSKLTTDVVTYCTEASNQKSKYAYQKILLYKKSTDYRGYGDDTYKVTAGMGTTVCCNTAANCL